jgi:hypothetical protein
MKRRVFNPKRRIQNKELKLMIESYSGRSDFLLSIKEQSLAKGYSNLTSKQKFFSELALIKEKDTLDQHYKEFTGSFL